MSRTPSTPIYQFKNGLKASSMLKCTALAAMAMSFAASTAYALPTGGNVVAGNSTITSNDGTNMVIDQTTGRAITDWQGFDILSGESVRINQPGAGSQSLNRVLGGKMTEIYGQLSSNGQVYIVNGSGVFFGGSAEVNVAGLVASSADIKNADFMAGRLNFSQPGRADASIINKGSITAAEGGLVALVAPAVRNDGVIQAKMGTVALGSAQTATIDMYGDGLYSFSLGQATDARGKDKDGNELENAVDNRGTISADGGSVLLTAKVAKNIVDNVINTEGIVEAKTARKIGGAIVLGGGSGKVRVAGKLDASGKHAGDKGGSITVTGETITVADNTKIDASGNAGGGLIRIGGDRQGGGDLQHANYVTIGRGSEIDVSAIESGDGGTAVVWSDLLTEFNGRIYGKGGANGGDGGFAEVSSKGELVFHGQGDLSSALGSAGTLLLDPTNIDINALLAIGILATLNANTDVIVTTPAIGPDAGNITVSAPLVWAGLGSLTLNAINNIIVNNNILSFAAGLATQGAINLIAGNNVNLNGVALLTSGGNIGVTGNNVTLTNSNISSALGNIAINNSGVFFSNLAGAIFNGGAGSINLRQSNAGIVQNAIDAVGPTGTGGATLTLGAGVFDESFTINKSNFTVTGQGQGVTIIRPSSAALLSPVSLIGPFAAPFGVAPIVLAQGGNNINISNLTLDASSIAAPVVGTNGNAPLVYSNAGGNVNFVQTVHGPFSSYGMISYAGTLSGHSARTINVNNMTNSGSNVFTGVQAMGDLLTFNLFNSNINAGTGQYGVAYTTDADGIISGNVINGGSKGTVGFFNTNGPILVQNNNIIGNGGVNSSGIDDGAATFAIAPSSNITINGNNISNAMTGILTNGGANWSINSNIITSLGAGIGKGIFLQNLTGANSALNNNISNFAIGIHNSNSNGTNIAGGLLTNNGIGILVNPSMGVTINGVTINGSATSGIELRDSDGSTITNNTITGGSDAIYLIDTDSSLVAGNQMSNVTIHGHGVRLENSSSNNVINNFMNNITSSGILLSTNSNNNQILGNIFNDVNNGIWLSNHSLSNQVRFNQLTNVHNVGVGIINGANNNIIDQNNTDGQIGILITDAFGEQITNNTLSNITVDGIRINTTGLGTGNHNVLNNNITAAPGNTGKGIHLQSATGTNNLIGNNITGFGVGIHNDGTNGTNIAGGTLSNNTTGILVNPSTGVSIVSAFFNGNPTGLSVVDSVVTLSNNVFSGGTDGLVVSGSTSDIIFGALSNAFTGQTGDFIKLINNGLNLTTTSIVNQLFNLTGSLVFAGGLNDTNSFLLENKLTHAADANGLGLLWWNPNNIYASGVIQPAIDAAKTYGFNQVNVDTGVYDETLVMDGFNQLTLTGGGRNVVIRPTSLAAVPLQMVVGGGVGQVYAPLVLVKDSNNVTVSGLQIDATSLVGLPAGANANIPLAYINAGGSANGITTFGNANSEFGMMTYADSTKGHSARIVNANQLNSSGNWRSAAEAIGDLSTFNIANSILNGSTGSYAALFLDAQGSIVNSNLTGGSKGGVGLYRAHDMNIIGNVMTGTGGTTGVRDASFPAPGLTNNIFVGGNTITGFGNGIQANNGSNWTVSGNNVTGVAGTNIGTGILLKNLTGTNSATNNNVSTFAVGIWNDNSNGTNISGGNVTNNTIGILVNPSTGVTINGVTISGSGTSGIELRDSDNSTITNNTISGGSDAIYLIDTDSSLVSGNQMSNVTVHGHGVRLENSSSNNVINNFMNNITSSGILLSTNSNNNQILGNIFNDVNNGIWLSNSSLNNQVRFNQLTNVHNVGVGIVNGANNNIIDRNNMDGQIGILVTDAFGEQITNNTLSNITVDGIRINTTGLGTGNHNVFNNTITAAPANTGKGIHLQSATGTNNLIGNNITGFGTGIHNDGTNNTNILNNTLTNNGTGILVNPSLGVTVSGNNITGGVFGIVALSSPSINILTNTINNILFDGIHIQNSMDALVRGNGLTNIGRDGIFANNSRNIEIDNNIILANGGGNTAAGRDAISVNDSRNANIHHNTISATNGGLFSGPAIGAGRYGIFVNDSRDARVSNNTLRALRFARIATSDAIRVNDSRNILVFGNHLSADRFAAVSLNNGIYVSNSRSARVLNNMIHATNLSLGAAQNGILVDNSGSSSFGGAGAMVNNNHVISDLSSLAAGHDGIHLRNSGNGFLGASASISNNTISGVGHDAIEGFNNGGVRINNNTLSLAGHNGILANQVRSADGNNVRLVGRDGIFIYDSGIFSASNNQTSRVGRNGMHFNNVGAFTASNNTISRSGQNGMLVHNAAGFRISGNDISRSGIAGIQLNNTLGGNIGVGLFGGGSGNNIHNNPIGILGNNVTGLLIRGNTIDDGNTGISLSNSRFIDTRQNNITNQTTGVLFNNVDDSIVRQNTISSVFDGVVAINGNNNLTVDNNQITVSNDGVRVSDSSNVTVRNNTINPAVAGNGTGVHFINTSSAVADNNTISNFDIGVHVDNSGGAQVINNTLTGNTTGVRVNPSPGVTISGNNINGGVDGIFVLNSPLVSILSNLIQNTTNTAVTLNNSNNAFVANNTINNNNTGLFALMSNNLFAFDNDVTNNSTGASLDQSDNATFDNNRFIDNNDGIDILNSDNGTFTFNNIDLNGIGVRGQNSNNLNFNNNTFAGNNTGLVLFNSINNTLTFNNFLNNTNRGALLNNVDNTFFGSNFFDNNEDGVITFFSNNLSFDNNIFVNHSRAGIDLNNGSNNGTFTFNTFEDNNRGVNIADSNGSNLNNNTFQNNIAGAELDRADNTIFSSNSFTNNNLGIRDISSDTLFFNNNNFNNNNVGVELTFSDNATFNSNSFDGSFTGVDLSVVGGANSFNNNIFTNNNTGVRGAASSNLTFNNNDFLGNTVRGIDLNNSGGGTFTFNNFDGNTNGVRLRNSGNSSFTGNTFNNNSTGFLGDSSDDLTFNNNTFSNNTMRGIDLQNSSNGTFTFNTLDSNDSGIRVISGNGHNFNGNIALNNTDAGIDILGTSNGTFTFNSLEGNGTGIRLDGTSDTTLSGNTFGNNTTGLSVNGGTNTTINGAGNIFNDNITGANIINSTGTSFANNTFNTNVTGVNIEGSPGVIFNTNTFDNNGVGISGTSSDGPIVDNNNFLNNETGVLLDISDNAVFTNNNFANNIQGVALINSNNANFNGDIFTDNLVGVDLNNSDDALFDSITFNSPVGGTALQINNGSSDAVVTNSTFTGGDVAIRISDPGSSMSFSGPSSSFTGSNFFFVLENDAMNGAVLDASNQIFDGTLASTFNLAQLNNAEARTIDVQDGFPTIGDVFFRSFFLTSSALDEFLREGGELFRTDIFSFSGETISNDIQVNQFLFNPGNVNLSLLNPAGGGTPPTGSLPGLSPAAGGSNLANLSPSAGGNANGSDLANLAPSAGPGGNCGNSFLGSGFAVGFDSGSCSVQ